MIILWIRKRKSEEPKGPAKNETDSFQKHDEVMKKFRLAHPDTSILNARDIMTADGNLLAPIQDVKLAEHVQN
ncbi:MAG TPA: hypothetical protein VMW86_02545 [Dehalococcoidales bacterium]|nr:hypothetical protein [Dehalococcoidales bacterium]